MEILQNKAYNNVKRITEEVPLYTAKLHTGHPPTRPRTQRQGLLVLQKRNCDVPDHCIALPPHQLDDNFRNFAAAYFEPRGWETLAEHRNDILSIDRVYIEEWVAIQEPHKIRRLGTDIPEIQERDWSRYTMMIKPEPKNVLEPDAPFKYAALQNIVHNTPVITAFWSSLFRELYRRVRSVLKPSIQVMIRKSVQEMSEFFTDVLMINKVYQKLEVDFSKYDKSQQAFCLETECHLMLQFGVDPELVALWRYYHEQTVATDFITGLRKRFTYQRKTGDSLTCLGNTLIAMMALANAFDLSALVAASFVGDDSILFFEHLPDVASGEHELRLMFNLDAKIITLGPSYFCSSFIVSNGERYAMIPDPIKRLERLGKHICRADEETDIKSRWQSFKDLMYELADYSMHEPLIKAVEGRYPTAVDIGGLLLALNSLREDENAFANLFYKTGPEALPTKKKPLKGRFKKPLEHKR